METSQMTTLSEVLEQLRIKNFDNEFFIKLATRLGVF